MMTLTTRTMLRLWLLFWLVLLSLALSRTEAAAASLVESLEIVPENGGSVSFRFQQQVFSYEIYLTAAQTVEIRLSAPGCSIVDSAGRRGRDSLSDTYAVVDGEIISYTVSDAAESELCTYVIHFYVREQEQPDPPPQPGPGDDPGAGDDGTVDPDADRGDEPDDILPAPPGEEPPLEEDTPLLHLRLYIGLIGMERNGLVQLMDTAPFLLYDENGGGYTMVPLRFVAEGLGAAVTWDGEQQLVGVALDGSSFTLRIGETLPGLPVAAMIRDNRTFVPLRYVMETLGAGVFWDNESQQIDIYYLPPQLGMPAAEFDIPHY